MTPHTLPETSRQCQQRGDDRDEPPLQPSRRADADQLSHQQPEIETAGVNQQPLQNVGVSAQVHASHAAGLVEMREGPLQALAAEPEQPQATRATNAPPIAIDRGLRLGLLLPVASPAIGLGDVTPDPHGFEVDERLIAVIPLVADDPLEAVALAGQLRPARPQ